MHIFPHTVYMQQMIPHLGRIIIIIIKDIAQISGAFCVVCLL